MVPKGYGVIFILHDWFGTILFGMVPKESSCSVQKGSGLEPFCLTWYQRYDIAMLFFVDLEPF